MRGVLHFVDIGVIVDHHCLETVLHFVDNGVIVDHHCLEVVLHFVDISVIVDLVNNFTNINKM
jgi:hypothetical protein